MKDENDQENTLDDGLVCYKTFLFSYLKFVFCGTRMYWQHIFV